MPDSGQVVQPLAGIPVARLDRHQPRKSSLGLLRQVHRRSEHAEAVQRVGERGTLLFKTRAPRDLASRFHHPPIELNRLAKLPQVLPTLAQLQIRLSRQRRIGQRLLQPLNRPAVVPRTLQPPSQFQSHGRIVRMPLAAEVEDVDLQPVVLLLHAANESLCLGMRIGLGSPVSDFQMMPRAGQLHFLSLDQHAQIAAALELPFQQSLLCLIEPRRVAQVKASLRRLVVVRSARSLLPDRQRFIKPALSRQCASQTALRRPVVLSEFHGGPPIAQLRFVQIASFGRLGKPFAQRVVVPPIEQQLRRSTQYLVLSTRQFRFALRLARNPLWQPSPSPLRCPPPQVGQQRIEVQDIPRIGPHAFSQELMNPCMVHRFAPRQAHRLLIPLLQPAARIGRDEERRVRTVGHAGILEGMASGKVYLVGAGPGDPGLVTLRAVEVLQQADIVFYDYLVNPAILRHCRPDAHLISLGQHGKGNLRTQDQINERVHAAAQVFQHIVRLKSGDPMVFARAGEELDYLAEHGIPFEIVPGVTAALAAASYAGIPVTHRDAASAVAFVTGREDTDKRDSSLDYPALAAFPGTLVFYMGVTSAEHWSQALIAAGKSSTTPVAILRRVTLPDQMRIDTTLAEVAGVVKGKRLRPPAVFIVGDVAAHGAAWSWFDKRPLFGQKVLVTRPAEQAEELARPLAELGAEVLFQPAIEIRPLPITDASDRLLDSPDRFDWLVFSSTNGVRCFFNRLAQKGRDLRALGPIKIAAIGAATADELTSYRLTVDLVPDEFRAESLAQALLGGAAGKRFLLVRASRGREVLAEELTKAGGIVEQVVVYESIDVERPAPEIAEKLSAGQIDWTTVTSSAIARSLARLLGESLRKTKLVSISPITSATLRELGFEPAAEAREYTMAGVVEAIRSAQRITE